MKLDYIVSVDVFNFVLAILHLIRLVNHKHLAKKPEPFKSRHHTLRTSSFPFSCLPFKICRYYTL